MSSYRKSLMTAREAAIARFAEKGFGQKSVPTALGDEDSDKLLLNSGLVPDSRKPTVPESEEGIGNSLYNIIFKANQGIEDMFKTSIPPEKTTGLGMTEEEKNMSMEELGETTPTDGSMALDAVTMENIIKTEAKLRNIPADVALTVFGGEGLNSTTYQSQIPRKGKGSLGGREASFGPTQLFTGGGLGNEYETQTGRSLISDNTVGGLTAQIQFALDKVAEKGWSPWYASKAAGVKPRQGLSNAKPIYNWREK